MEWSLHPNQHGPGLCCHNYRFRFKISASPSANRNRSTRHCSEGFPRLFLSLFLPLLQTNYLAVIDSSGGDQFGCSTLREIFRTLTQSTHVGPKRTPPEACWLPHSHKLLGPPRLGWKAGCLSALALPLTWLVDCPRAGNHRLTLSGLSKRDKWSHMIMVARKPSGTSDPRPRTRNADAGGRRRMQPAGGPKRLGSAWRMSGVLPADASRGRGTEASRRE